MPKTGIGERLLLRVGEAAEAMGISRSSLYQAINRGEIPVIRITGSRSARIPKVWLERWVAEKISAWEKATSLQPGGQERH